MKATSSVRSQPRTGKISRARSMWCLFLFCLFLFSLTSSAQTYTDIFDFDGTAHGCCPQFPAILAQGQDGNLYGTTPTGGTSNVGTVFKLTPTGTLTVLFNFDITNGTT